MHTERTLERTIARFFEGRITSFAPFAARTIVHEIDLPRGVRVLGVGGATIGGSGKTPLAIAIVRALVERGERAAFVGHAYRGRVDRPTRVSTDDDVRLVGDEALVAARALRDVAPVFVGETRARAISFAAKEARTLVVDHLLQTRPRPLDVSVLALDDRNPWGSERTFPFGDLVALPDALASLADVVVRIGSDDARHALGLPALSARLGIVTSVARPERILRELCARDVHPVVHVERADHARTPPREIKRISTLAARHRIDAWLADEKTFVSIAGDLGAPLVPIAHRVMLSPSLVDRLALSC